MAVSDAQIAHMRDLFDAVGPITTRKMFGGLGIYLDGRIFALLMSDGTLRLKGAGEMAATLDAAGWERWTYTRDSGVSAAMPYWTIPDEVQDDPDELGEWARRALSHL
ncbi:TfoX family protein [Aliishimia ponticola]|uniref:TfoX family protein n=1 Tax=Aliishimia ponticola TaxID=2499833 RepID=A0A4S4NKJ3_9RHOB|nr:TfoX/Sxy family protein [Aliishimia ponticola]THH38818.1 TfoX family protein [Aliishimia ponticola]